MANILKLGHLGGVLHHTLAILHQVKLLRGCDAVHAGEIKRIIVRISSRGKNVITAEHSVSVTYHHGHSQQKMMRRIQFDLGGSGAAITADHTERFDGH